MKAAPFSRLTAKKEFAIMMIFNTAPLHMPLVPGQIPGTIMSSSPFHTLPLDLIHQDADIRH
jgi:hypothetical protein